MSQDKEREALLKRANALLDKLLDHDLQYSAQTGAAQIVDDLIAALATQPPAVQGEPQWLPIETAPKDGKVVLLGYHNSHGNWRTMRGCWLSKDYIDEYWEDPEGVDAGWFETPVEAEDPPNCWPTDPTHWMPLPPPPGIHSRGEGEKA